MMTMLTFWKWGGVGSNQLSEIITFDDWFLVAKWFTLITQDDWTLVGSESFDQNAYSDDMWKLGGGYLKFFEIDDCVI